MTRALRRSFALAVSLVPLAIVACSSPEAHPPILGDCIGVNCPPGGSRGGSSVSGGGTTSDSGSGGGGGEGGTTTDGGGTVVPDSGGVTGDI